MTELDPNGDPDATRPHSSGSPAAGPARPDGATDPDDAYSQVITAPSPVVTVPAQAGPPAAENLFAPARPIVAAGPPRGPAVPTRAYGASGPATQGFPSAPGFPAGFGPPAQGFPAGPVTYAPHVGTPGHPGSGYGPPASGLGGQHGSRQSSTSSPADRAAAR